MDYRVSLDVVQDIEVTGKRVGDYWYDKSTATIYYQLPYPFPCKFAVRALRHVYVTPWMLRLPTFLKYHNIDWLVQQLMQVMCVDNNAVLLHGSAWKKDGVGHLAVGFANSGKTYRVLKEVREGAEFCSDENVIVKDGIMYPIRRQSSVSWYHKVPLTMKQKARLCVATVKAKLFPIFEPNIFVNLPYDRSFFRLDKLIYLTEGSKSSLALLTDNEFPFYTNPVLQTYAYASGWDLDAVYAKYRMLLRRIECSSKR